LAALGLQRFAPDLAAGRALALDPSAVVDDRVVLDAVPSAAPGWHQELPAVVVQHRVVPQYLPAVLLPRPVVGRLWATVPKGNEWRAAEPSMLVVGRARGFEPAEVRAVVRAVREVPDPLVDDTRLAAGPLAVRLGNAEVGGILELGRLDASYSVVLDSPGDVRLAVVLAVVVSVLALAVALRLAALTGRPDDELLDVLGADRSTLRRAAAGQALVLGLLAVPIGTLAGVIATAVGLAGYNGSGRVHDGVALPPIPFDVPGALVVGALLVPLVAAGLAWLASVRRRPLDLQDLADRLAW
jgi:hypothetical protein